MFLWSYTYMDIYIIIYICIKKEKNLLKYFSILCFFSSSKTCVSTKTSSLFENKIKEKRSLFFPLRVINIEYQGTPYYLLFNVTRSVFYYRREMLIAWLDVVCLLLLFARISFHGVSWSIVNIFRRIFFFQGIGLHL